MTDAEKPPAADAPKVSVVEEPLVIKLRKPVIANGDEVNELTFREPTAGDIERCGNPVLADFLSSETPKISYDAKSMTTMMAALAAVPPSTIRQMHPKDWENGALMLAYRFFTPDL